MDEILSIFTESNEDMGWMFKSYEPLLGVVNEFLGTCENCIKELDEEPDKVKIDLKEKIDKFKKDIDRKFKPQAIEIYSCRKYMSQVKKFQSELSSTLTRFSKLKDKIAFGGNYMRAIINKPKVYSKDISEEKYELINNNIRNVNRAMDWVEKVIIDLYNMADQDLNILEIVDRVYNKHHIYEGTELPAGVIVEQDADIVQMLPESKYGTYLGNTRDKKTSSRPIYIDRNHDIAKWGEDDGEQPPEEDKTLDDYRRPSAEPEEQNEELPPYDGPTDNEKEEEAEKKAEDKAAAIQNYYYYTYNNSLNKHIKNDHSVDNSTHTKTDDHSTNKQINSGNVNGEENKEQPKENPFHAVESAWLDLPFETDVYTEAATTARGKSEYEALCKDLKRKPSSKELQVPDAVTVHFDSGNESSEAAEYISQTFKHIVASKVFTDDGKYMKDKSIEEVPTARYMLNQLLHKDKSFDALFDINIQSKLEDYIRSLAKDAGEECPSNIIGMIKKFNVQAKTIFLKPAGQIGFCFDTSLEPEHGIGINFNPFKMEASIGDDSVAFESVMVEEVGDADDDKPKSDHPIRDKLMDIDRASAKGQQKVKKAVQDAQNVGRALTKPIKRTEQWITNMISNWKDANETNIKEKMADPHARSNIYSALKKAIEIGALYKAGILLNPLFLFLAVTKGISDKKKSFRIRNEMIGELKTEIEIVDKKIQDAEYKHDDKAKYELMRFKNELNKKLLRVGGGKGWSKII